MFLLAWGRGQRSFATHSGVRLSKMAYFLTATVTLRMVAGSGQVSCARDGSLFDRRGDGYGRSPDDRQGIGRLSPSQRADRAEAGGGRPAARGQGGQSVAVPEGHDRHLA